MLQIFLIQIKIMHILFPKRVQISLYILDHELFFFLGGSHTFLRAYNLDSEMLGYY